MSEAQRTDFSHERAERLERQLGEANETIRTLRGALHAEQATNKVLLQDVERLERCARPEALRNLADCPARTAVLFLCGDGFWKIGMMEHNVEKVGGQREDSFWGPGGFSDDEPPHGWLPLPTVPPLSVRSPLARREEQS